MKLKIKLLERTTDTYVDTDTRCDNILTMLVSKTPAMNKFLYSSAVSQSVIQSAMHASILNEYSNIYKKIMKR